MNTVRPSSQNLVWIDLEMTGLDPNKEKIIEIATIITDSELNIIDEGPNLAIHQPEKLLVCMDEWNTKHHTASGLLQRVRDSKITNAKAEMETLEFIKKYCKEKKSPLCGNSVWHDRRFLSKYMSSIDQFLHYHNIDVSSLKELSRRWYPKKLTPPKKKRKHLALDDIRESIEELAYYKDHLFIPR